MLSRRNFLKGLFTAGVVLGSTSLDIYSANLLKGKAKPDLPLPKIRVFGLGGCGKDAINYMIQSGLKGVDFILADKNPSFMTSSLTNQQLVLKTDFSEIENGDKVAFHSVLDKDKAKIRQALEGSDLVFIIAGMGGETGTFWAPIIAQISNELEILNLAVITTPLYCESFQTKIRGEIGLEKLIKIADTVIPIDLSDNELLVFPETPFDEVYELANKRILSAVKEITGLILFPGLIELDLKDIKTILSKEGLTSFSTGVASGEGRAREAAQKAISELKYRGLKPASHQQVIVSFTANPTLTFEEMTEATGVINEETQDQVTLFWGTSLDRTIGKEIRVTLFVTGRKYQRPYWSENIFCQVENRELMSELKSLTREMDWTIRQGEPDTPDMVATGFFVAIIDRSLLGEWSWNYFLKYYNETKDDTPLIIVDKSHHLGLPDHKNIKFIDLNNPQAIEEIKSTIRRIRL